ncbi:unnamed protein product [Urochloa humidicola]
MMQNELNFKIEGYKSINSPYCRVARFSGGRHGERSHAHALLFVTTLMHTSCLLYCLDKSSLSVLEA